MAYEKYEPLLQQSVNRWNQWRLQNPAITPNLARANLTGVDLSGADLSGANLERAFLSRANLSNVNFQRAILRRANLSYTNLSGYDFSGYDLSHTVFSETNLSGANLSNANLEGAIFTKANLSGANLKGCILRTAILSNADLRNQNFSGCNLSGVSFKGANLSGVNFKGANLEGANLSEADLTGADFSGANLERAFLSRANLSKTNFQRAILRRANLSYTNLSGYDFSGYDLSHTVFSETNLSGANLSNANLEGATSIKANLSEVNLKGCILRRAILNNVDLRNQNFSEWNLSGVFFKETNLSGVNFKSTNLEGADLSEADLSEADLSEANLKGVNLSKANLSRVTLDVSSLKSVTLKGANLTGFDFSTADLSELDLSETNLTRVNFTQANLTKANLSNAELSQAKFRGAILRGANFSGTNLSNFYFSGLDISEAKFCGANLIGINLSRANLSGADFSFDFNTDLLKLSHILELEFRKIPSYKVVSQSKAKTIISKAILERAANLSLANLSKANLEGANLEGANLEGANLNKAILRNASISGARLQGTNFEGAELNKTCFTKDIIRYFLDKKFHQKKGGGFVDDAPIACENNGLYDTDASASISTKQKSLVRYANIDCPDKTIVNQSFSVFVQLLLEPPEPNSTALQVEDAGTVELPKIEVVLRTRGFEIEGSNTLVIDVERDDDSEARFVLIPQQTGEQQIRVDYYQNGRRIGTARRNILVVERFTTANVPQPDTSIVIRMRADQIVPPPDLELCVELDRQNNRKLYFELHSIKQELDYHHAKVGQVTLQGSPLEKMQAVYRELSQLAAQSPTQNTGSDEQRTLVPLALAQSSPERAERRLIAAGNRLWDELIPDELKQQYWQFKSHVKSLLITSDEPWVPWEMIKPYRYVHGKEEQDPFWCQQFAISRWLSGPGTADELLMKTVVPVAPTQVNLQSVQDEITFLEQLINLRSGISSIAALSRGLDLEDYIKQNEFSILHFACHGMFDDTLPNESAILLADGPLRPSDLRLYFEQSRPRPLIFVNACHGGRVGFSFTGLGGWAEQLVRARVGAFVGAMWEVNDTLALLFAKTFYKALLQDDLTIAEAFRQSREAIRQAAPYNSTWLAYSLYADPEARIQEIAEITEDVEERGVEWGLDIFKYTDTAD